jgi:hypothetical protein
MTCGVAAAVYYHHFVFVLFVIVLVVAAEDNAELCKFQSNFYPNLVLLYLSFPSCCITS